MKKLLLIASLFATSLFAETTPVVSAPVEVSQPAKVNDAKDAFMTFLLTKIDKYSTKMEDTMGNAITLAEKEAKPLMEEFIRWRIISHGFKFFATFFVWCISLFYLRRNIRIAGDNINTYSREWRGSTGVYAGVNIVVSFALAIITLCNIPNLLDFIQAIVAPRIYIMDQLLLTVNSIGH